MRNIIRTIGKICFFGLVMGAPALAQNQLVTTTPAPAVVGPAFDVSVGYTRLAMQMPAAGRANFNGLDFSGNIGLSPRWGATLDSSYLYTPEVLNTKHHGYVSSLLAGSVFYPVAHGNTRVFVHALAGAGLIDGAVPISDTQDFHGWLLHPSYAAGGGVEHTVSAKLAVRLNGDYVRTSFYDSTGTERPQNNLRLTMSFVFRLKDRPHRSSAQLW
jgi:hypothetical protein